MVKLPGWSWASFRVPLTGRWEVAAVLEAQRARRCFTVRFLRRRSPHSWIAYAALVCLGGNLVAGRASAQVTVDLVWRDSGTSSLVVPVNDPSGAGCAELPGTGRCLDAVLINSIPMAIVSWSVGWDENNGVLAASVTGFTPFGVPGGNFTALLFPVAIVGPSPECAGSPIFCTNTIGNVGGQATPFPAAALSAGTYTLATFRMDTSGVTATTVFQAIERLGIDGFLDSSGNIVAATLGSATLDVGAEAVPSLGAAGLTVLAASLLAAGALARRSRVR